MSERTKRQQKRTRSGFGTGTTSLLMIFTVLCFATLALLSLSTAASNKRVQQRSLTGTVALAEAEGQAAEALAALDEAVQAGADAEDTALAQGWQAGGESGTFQYVIPLENEHELVTVIRFSDGGGWQMVSQKSVYTGQWTPEQEGQIWSGDA